MSRRLLAVLLSVFLLVVSGILPGTAPQALAEPSGTGYATLNLTGLTPSTVTRTTSDTVTVTGRITNTFDRPLDHLEVTLQRGSAVSSAVALRTSLMGDASSFPVAGGPTRVSSKLEPGKSADFSASISLSDAAGLDISEPGVYPLLVSVAGAPESSHSLRLVTSRTLLPVVSLPPDSGRARDYVDPAVGGPSLVQRDGAVNADVRDPSSFTMLWPLAAPPQQSPGVLGGGTEPLRLTSDELAEALAPSGRLGAQLTALTELAATDGTPDADTSEKPSDQSSSSSSAKAEKPARRTVDDDLRDSICIAVDPDLLVTVNAMTHGYLVSTDPADPQSPTQPGHGKDAASDWLNKLTDIAKHVCITALPFAQSGLDSLDLIGDEGLTSTALKGPADLVSSILGVQTVHGPTVPAIGTLTSRGRKVLESQQLTTAAVASSSLEPRTNDPDGRYRTGDVQVQAYDEPITAALGAVGSRPVVPGIMPNWQQPDLSGESAVSRRQTAAASIAFPMLANAGKNLGDDSAGDAAPSSITGNSAFIMPPTYWSPSADDAKSLLSSARLMLSSGTARSLPLRQLAEDLPQAGRPSDLTTPGDVEPIIAQGFPVSTKDVGTMREQLDMTWQLQSSLVDQADSTTTPQVYLAPIREDILRAVSTPETSDLAGSRTARDLRIGGVGSTLSRMRESVALLDPGGRYTLASERSPLLLIVRNDLALPIRVRLDINAPETLEVGDVGVVEIPAQGTRQLQIPTHASSSEKATVTISLVTSTGVALSSPVDLSIYSNAYGKPLFWITISAAVILILLTARRLWHRFRGEADPADEDRPEPDERELMLASTPYEQRLEASREFQIEPPLEEIPVDLNGHEDLHETDLHEHPAGEQTADSAEPRDPDDRPEHS